MDSRGADHIPPSYLNRGISQMILHAPWNLLMRSFPGLLLEVHDLQAEKNV